MRNTIKTAALIATLATPVTATAGGVAELDLGTQSTVVDTKLYGPISDKVSYFCRARVSADYEGNVGYFTFTDITLDIGTGFGVMGEGQFSSAGFDPRFGLSHTGNFGDFHTYVFATIGPKSKDFQPGAILAYTPMLNEETQLMAKVEAFAGFSGEGYQWSAERVRVGAGEKDFKAGVGVDMSQSKEGFSLDNIIIFFSKDF